MPAPVGPYTPVVRAGEFLYTSGQVALKDGALVAGFRAQVEQCMANLRAVLEENGSSLDRLVKTTVFLTDMNNYAEFNEAYIGALGDSRPARSCVAVRALPLGALVEIEGVALA